MSTLRNFIYNIHSQIDQRLKFPHLKRGDIGVQVGFDMTYPLTSDLFKMARQVGSTGHVIGIDPDPVNHQIAKEWIERKGWQQIRLLEKATFHKVETLQLKLARQPSWNQLTAIPLDDTVSFREETLQVAANTLDNILQEQQIDLSRIRHISITNNGAEYATLQGMTQLLSESPALSITLIAGRQDPSGVVSGLPDFEVCQELLRDFGFECRFHRIHHLFWWGFCTKLLLNRKWVYNRPNYGVIFAARGHSIPWFQSFS